MTGGSASDSRRRTDAPRVAIFGAGAFGGWTALELARRGARVTLLDAWGPGNVRASSGGETRVIRATYGTHSIYTDLASRALTLWRSHDARTQRSFYRRTGALWMLGRSAPRGFAPASHDALASRGVSIEPLTTAEAARRYPQIDFNGVTEVLLEPDAGYLLARRACEHVVECLVAEGGQYRIGAAASPLRLDDSPVRDVLLDDGTRIEADAFVFACGPWLATLFPDVIGPLLSVTRQEVYYFGTPAGDARFSDERLPVWVDFGDRFLYGIPGNAHRGFKIADDTSGPAFDPTNGTREADAAGVSAARTFLSRRFPDLARAPLVGSEVCQYESTPDANFIVDRHPAITNVWLAGGGSGHGYKMGPALGEMIASSVLGVSTPPSEFTLHRFATPPPDGWKRKWS